MAKTYSDFVETRTAELIELYEEKGKNPNEKSIARRVAREFIKDFMSDEENRSAIPETIMEAMTKLFVKTRKAGSGSGRITPKAKIVAAIRALILDNGVISEQDVFTTSMELGSAWGRSEMKSFIKNQIKGAPEDRIWVELETSADEPMGNYVLKAAGPDAPEGWEGYMPVDEEVDL